MALVESFSGVRGIFGTELTEELAIKYGMAYSEFLKRKFPSKKLKIVIGRDTRISGKRLFDSLAKGIDSDIIDIGVASTPITENAVRFFHADGGIIITASHNEPEFNGFKFLDSNGASLNPVESRFVIELANKKEIINFSEEKKAIDAKEREAIDAYKLFLKEALKIDKINSNARILVDVNGGTGFVSEELFRDYGVNALCINLQPREFKRKIEPTEASLKYLQEKINENNCDFAIGFDCDADRIEILMKDGRLASSNHLLALAARQIFSNPLEKNRTIVVNDATSYVVKDVAEKYNARWVEVDVGETNIIGKMAELNAKIGGEGSSGGVMISPSKCKDGIMMALFLLKIMGEQNKSLEELIATFPKYYYLREKIQLTKDFSNMKEKIKNYYIANGFSILEAGGEDGGLKALKNNSWIYFRQSKTESNLLRVFADSKDEATAKSLIEEGKRILEG